LSILAHNNLIGKRRKIVNNAIIGVSFFFLVVSLIFFALCATKPYMGAVLSFGEHGWLIESVDRHGTAFSAGIQVGDKPLEVNAQSADTFLQRFEKSGSIRLIEQLKVLQPNGQILSSEINVDPQSRKSFFEIISWFVLSAAFFLTGFYILSKKPDNTAALILLLSGTTLSVALSSTLAAERLIPISSYPAVLAALIGPWLLLHFFLILPDERAWLRNDPRILIIYVIPAIAIVMYPIIGYANGQPLPEFRMFRLLSYGMGFLGVVGVAIYNYVRAQLPQTRQQMKIVLIGCVFGLVPFVALNAIPAAVTGAVVLPSDVGLAFLSFIPLSLGYAVVAKQLLEIEVVIRRSFIYAVITIILAMLIWAAFALVFSSGIAPGFFERFILALGLSALAVFLLGPIKNLVETMIDKLFYKDRFDYRKTIQNLSTSLSATSDKEVASSLIIDAPMSALNLAGASLFIATDTGSFEVGAARGIFATESRQRDLLSLIVRRNVGKEFPNLADTPNPDIAFVIPLVAADKEVGVLFISGKTSRQEFNGSDFYLIQGLASVAAVSLRGILIAERDISERRRHEQAILNAKQEWESTFDSIPDLICILDADHNIIRVNRAMADKLGLSPAQTIGKKCYELMHNTDAPPESCPGFSSGKACGPSSEIARCGCVYQINISTLNNDGKSSGRYVHIARDVTAVKNAEAEQQRLKEKAELSSRLAAVGEMAAGIAHEINNPLTGVLGYAELMLSEDIPDELKEEVKVIADGSKRVAEIVKRMLTFARQTKPFKTSLSVTELIDNTLELRNYVLRTAGIDVVKNYQDDLPWIVADPGQLQQVFLNLIVNAEHAIKKTGHTGVITISAKKISDHLRIVFSDNGPGIEPEVLPKLFQPFFTTKSPGEGTGLGLSISRSIILEHGGSIDIASELGRGATFTIELPLNSESENVLLDPVTTVSRRTNSNIRVLVIDDEISIQRLLRQSLSDQNRIIDVAGNAQQALELIRSSPYDIILMDLRMPGTSGMALYREIISQKPEFEGRVIVITGDALGEDVQAFISKHRLEVLTKPFDQSAVQTMVDRVLSPNPD